MTDSTRDTPRILLAEDNDTLRVAIGGLLRLAGHRADSVRNGREAVEAASRRDYDVVFLDAQMPEMGGPEAMGRLRRDRNHRPLIVGLSAGPWPVGEESQGPDEFIPKPVRLDDLVRVLRHVER